MCAFWRAERTEGQVLAWIFLYSAMYWGLSCWVSERDENNLKSGSCAPWLLDIPVYCVVSTLYSTKGREKSLILICNLSKVNSRNDDTRLQFLSSIALESNVKNKKPTLQTLIVSYHIIKENQYPAEKYSQWQCLWCGRNGERESISRTPAT